MTTYGTTNVPGVKVATVTSDAAPSDVSDDMSEYEYQLCLILLLVAYFEDEYKGRPTGGIDMDAAESALQCYGYDEYEAMPMLWATLEHVGEEYLD